MAKRSHRPASWRRHLSPGGTAFTLPGKVALLHIEDRVLIATADLVQFVALAPVEAMELSYALQAFAKGQGMEGVPWAPRAANDRPDGGE